jgi:hypothetical protein
MRGASAGAGSSASVAVASNRLARKTGMAA